MVRLFDAQRNDIFLSSWFNEYLLSILILNLLLIWFVERQRWKFYQHLLLMV